jgi:hypothetical protein
MIHTKSAAKITAENLKAGLKKHRPFFLKQEKKKYNLNLSMQDFLSNSRYKTKKTD